MDNDKTPLKKKNVDDADFDNTPFRLGRVSHVVSDPPPPPPPPPRLCRYLIVLFSVNCVYIPLPIPVCLSVIKCTHFSNTDLHVCQYYLLWLMHKVNRESTCHSHCTTQWLQISFLKHFTCVSHTMHYTHAHSQHSAQTLTCIPNYQYW